MPCCCRRVSGGRFQGFARGQKAPKQKVSIQLGKKNEKHKNKQFASRSCPGSQLQRALPHHSSLVKLFSL